MILLTGATGFVGSHILRRLLEEGREVRCLVRDPSQAPAFMRHECELLGGDLLNEEAVREATIGVEAIIHLVGIIREGRGASFEGVHVRATRLLVEAARAAEVGRFLHMSALGARDGTESRYYQSKWFAEEAVRKSGLDYTIFRPSVIFGREDKFINLLARMAQKLPVLPSLGGGLIQPIWVEDVVTCFVRSLEEPQTAGRSFDLGGKEVFSFDEVMGLICEHLDIKKRRVNLPKWLLRAEATVGEVVPIVPLTREQLFLLGEDNSCDIGEMVGTFGLEPRSLHDYLGELLSPSGTEEVKRANKKLH